jgi:hypothetical protein
MPSNNKIRELIGVIDPRLGRILIGMNDDIHALRGSVRDLATLMNQLADLMGKQQVVMSAMKGYTKRLQEMGMAVGSDPSVTGEVDEPL